MPKLPDLAEVCRRDKREKQQQDSAFNSHHQARELPDLNSGDTVWIPDRNAEGTMQEDAGTRSYQVDTGDDLYRRNRRHLIKLYYTAGGFSGNWHQKSVHGYIFKGVLICRID